MVVISGPEDLVWKVKTKRMSAHDALLILERFEKNAGAGEEGKIRAIRGFLEDEAAKENTNAFLRANRQKRIPKKQLLDIRIKRNSDRIIP